MKLIRHMAGHGALLGLLTLGCASAFAGTTDAASKPVAASATDTASADTVMDEEAIAGLERMGKALRALNHYNLHSSASVDLVLDTGQKIQLDAEVDYRVQMPDLLYAELRSDRRLREVYYNGDVLTVYSPKLNYYASIDTKAATLADLAIAADAKYGMKLPLTDLFFWGTKYAPIDVLTSAIYVGGGIIDGEAIEQLALRQDGVDWQVWLSKKTSLPRKIVITSLDDPTRPQYSARLRWDTTSEIDAKRFTFVPPEGAGKIEFVPEDDQGDTTPATGEGK